MDFAILKCLFPPFSLFTALPFLSSSNERPCSDDRQGILGDGSRILLVKNLPYSTRENEVHNLFAQALGSAETTRASIERVVLPPSRAVCVVVFKLSQDARTVFKKLAYRRFKQSPLYLQFLPNEVIHKYSQANS